MLRLKPSRYNIFISLDNKTVLGFNGVTKSIGRFTKKQHKCVKTLMMIPDDSVIQMTDGIKIKKYLLRNGFLIPRDQDELATLRDRNRFGINSTDCFDLLIMPTMDCNFKCFYCFEEHRPEVMQMDVQKRLMRWGEKNVAQYRSLGLSWFGGEPLLEIDTLVRLSEYFRNLCSQSSTIFHNMITTNGYLLSQHNINRLLEAGIRTFNVTVDGPIQWHDKFRPHRDQGNTFQKVVDGIIRVLESSPNARMNLRVNYNAKNFKSIPELFGAFPEGIRSRIQLILRQIFGKQADKHALTDKTSREQKVYETAAQLGFQMSLMEHLIDRKETYCYADKENSLIISPRGDIYKCSLNKFTKESRFGELDSDGDIQWERNRIDMWKKADGFEDPVCQECLYLPLCMGGCRTHRVNGAPKGECAQPFEDVEFFIKQIYLSRKAYL